LDSLSKWQAVVLPEMLTIVRAAEILLVLEGIYGSETEADEERPPEEGEADKRDLPSVCLHFPRHARTLLPLPKGSEADSVPQE